MKVGKLNEVEQKAMAKVLAEESELQAKLDKLYEELKAAKKVEIEIRDRIRPLREQMVPISQRKAGIANIDSMDKYFDHPKRHEFLDA